MNKSIVYRNLENIELKMDVHYPNEWERGDARPAIVLFFGGGWEKGEPKQFKLFAEHFAGKGFVVFTPEYRIKSKHNTTPYECVEDGKAAVAWIRKNAKSFEIDDEKIVVGGGSAGGHVALCTAMIEGYIDEKNKNLATPNALVLINPVVDTTETGYGAKKIGGNAQSISPVHYVNKNAPPTIIFHGTEDKIVPFENVQRFKEVMKKMGNTCILHPYEGEGHGLVVKASDPNEHALFLSFVEKIEQFLRMIGIH